MPVTTPDDVVVHGRMQVKGKVDGDYMSHTAREPTPLRHRIRTSAASKAPSLAGPDPSSSESDCEDMLRVNESGCEEMLRGREEVFDG